MAVFSCSTEKVEKEEAVSLRSDEPTEDQLLQIGIQKLGKWVDYWESKGANFNVSNFDLNQEHLYEVIEWPEENVISDDNPLKGHQIPNPNSKGVVDIYQYKILIDEAKQVDFNPDAEVIYFKNNGMRERLLFIGPSGVFEDAVWISESHLLVSGHIQKEEGFVPVVWLILPEEHRYSVYENSFSTLDYSPESYLKEKLSNLKFLR
ncbi:MAG: bifunctional isocitrate dehydrogenase kinase/phosphatase [Anditalea sp.]